MYRDLDFRSAFLYDLALFSPKVKNLSTREPGPTNSIENHAATKISITRTTPNAPHNLLVQGQGKWGTCWKRSDGDWCTLAAENWMVVPGRTYGKYLKAVFFGYSQPFYSAVGRLLLFCTVILLGEKRSKRNLIRGYTLSRVFFHVCFFCGGLREGIIVCCFRFQYSFCFCGTPTTNQALPSAQVTGEGYFKQNNKLKTWPMGARGFGRDFQSIKTPQHFRGDKRGGTNVLLTLQVRHYFAGWLECSKHRLGVLPTTSAQLYGILEVAPQAGDRGTCVVRSDFVITPGIPGSRT